MATEMTPLVIVDPIQKERSHGARASCKWLKTFIVYFFTDWPWEIAKYISRPDTIPDDSSNDTAEEKFRCSFKWLFIWPALVIFRLSLIVMAVVTQLMTCIRRDRINTNLTEVHFYNNGTLKCNETSEVIGSFIVPDTIIVLLAFWVYFGLKFGNQYCRGCFGWKELNSIMKADSIARLSNLIKAVGTKLQEKTLAGNPSLTVAYTVIPIVYIGFSQLVCVLYLCAFKLTNKNVTIQPLGKHTLPEETKDSLIRLSFVGFIALDILYLQVIMRYAYRCQMIIYYLQVIKKKVDKFKTVKKANEQKIKDCEEIMKNTETAHMFLKELNASSGTIALVTIIVAFQAANCAFFLLSDDTNDINTAGYFPAVAVLLRLILWVFLAVFPFHKAAGVNKASKELRDLGLVMHRPSLTSHCDTDGSNNGVHVSLKARVFGISINPYLVIILLLLILMVGSKFKWYADVLG